MLPDEVHALMAKILFFIFAVCILCVGKVNAQTQLQQFSQQQVQQLSQQIQQQQ